MPSALPARDEWDKLVVKMGTLTIQTGYLEMAIIMMVCRILDKSEKELGIRSNDAWCKKFREVAPASWSEDQKSDLANRLRKVRRLYRRRNDLIHASLGTVSNGSIPGVPTGSVVDLRSFGWGFQKKQGNTWTIGLVGKRVHLHEIDGLINDITAARLGLVPYMELVDKIRHPARPFPTPARGKLLSECN